MSSSSDAVARRSDVETLRRLTRDAHGEITSLRDRLGELERSVATERASRATDRAAVTARVDFASTPAHLLGRPAAGRAVGAVPLGIDASCTVEAPFANGDALVVRLAARGDPSARAHHPPPPLGERDDDARAAAAYVAAAALGRPLPLAADALSVPSAPTPADLPVTLDKVTYRRRAGADAWAKASIVGGEGADCAPALNPLSEGDSLTGLGARGARARSRAVAAPPSASRGSSATASSAPPSARSAAARGRARRRRFRRFRRLAAALPLPPAGDRAGHRAPRHARGGVALGVLRRRVRRRRPRDEDGLRRTRSRRSAALGLGAQALFAVGERALVAGWASSDGGDWGVAATAPPRGASPGWGVVVGRDADAGTAGEGAGAERSGRAHARGRSGAGVCEARGTLGAGDRAGRHRGRRRDARPGDGEVGRRPRVQDAVDAPRVRRREEKRGEERRRGRAEVDATERAYIPDNNYFRKYHTKVLLFHESIRLHTRDS